MKKKLLLLALATALLAGCYQLYHTADRTGSAATATADKHELLAARSGEARTEFPGEAATYWAGLHETPNGENPARLDWEAKLAVERDREQRGAEIGIVANFSFEEWGPGNFGGRLRGILPKSNDPDTLLVGSVSGGIWKSEDGGASWRPIDDFLPNLAIGSMLNDPDDADRAWAGTGEGFFNGDAAQGLGIFRSDDYGETWAQLAATNNDDFFYVNRLARVPSSNILIAATRSGLWRSTDLGSTWGEVSGATVTGRGFVDVKLDPSNTSRLYAYLYGASDGFLPLVTVNTPAGIAGDYPAASAQFGPGVPMAPGTTADLEVVDDGTANGSQGCNSLVGFTSGRIAVVDRGNCAFTLKVANAQAAGAVAAIVVNNVAGPPFQMGGTDPTITIPSVMVSMADGAIIKGQLPSPGVNATLVQGNQLGSAVFRSTDSGANWTLLDDTNGLPTTDISRMELGIGSDGVVYASVSNAANATRGLWRSADGGNNWSQTPSATPFIERQGWYDLTIGVDPSDSDTVYMGAVDMYATTDAGTNIAKRTFWNPGPGQVPEYVHADHHVLVFHPSDPDTFWIGCDGGIFKTTDGGNTFVDLNHDLRVAQYYGIAAHPDGSAVIGGTQDNGTHLYFGDTAVWLEWFGGDGGFAAWDVQQPGFVYGSLPNAGLFGSSDGGLTSVQIALPDTTGAAFINPFALDPNNGNRMLVGTDNVFYSSNARQLDSSTWQDVSGAIGTVSATTISPINGAVAYAGTTGGLVYKTTGLGTGGAWNQVDSGMPASDVTWIEVDPHDATGNTVYATFADYGSDRVFKSTNGGSTWSSIHGNLPDIPMFAITVDPTDPSRLFVGSELGLWVTESNTEEGTYVWDQYAYGTAWTRVMQLVWTGDDTLWVGTHGRSIYRAQRSPVQVTVGDTLDAGCLVDGYLDADETAMIPISVTNTSGAALSAVTASVSSGYTGLDVLSGILGYGTINPGDTVTQNFEVSLEELNNCLDTAQLTATVDYSTGTAQHVFELTLGADPVIQTGSLTEDAEDADTLFTHEARLDDDDWVRTTTQANSGLRSWFASDVDNFADKSLISPWLEVQGGTTVLNFALYYDLEGDATQYWDGVVLELRTEGGDWVDIGELSTVPYDGQLFTNNSAPAREAWSGVQTSWRSATVNLGSTYNGETVQFRFRVICDTLTANPGGGFWVDDISISNVSYLESLACNSLGCSLVFEDGFESGNFSAWTSTVP